MSNWTCSHTSESKTKYLFNKINKLKKSVEDMKKILIKKQKKIFIGNLIISKGIMRKKN